MSHGFVYFVANDAMRGLLKIGMTERSPARRLVELSASTSVPSPFVLLAYVAVDDAREAEYRAHDWLSDYRHSRSREFFKCTLAEACMPFYEDHVIVTNHGAEHYSIELAEGFHSGRDATEAEYFFAGHLTRNDWIDVTGQLWAAAKCHLDDYLATMHTPREVVGL